MCRLSHGLNVERAQLMKLDADGWGEIMALYSTLLVDVDVLTRIKFCVPNARSREQNVFYSWVTFGDDHALAWSKGRPDRTLLMACRLIWLHNIMCKYDFSIPFNPSA